MLGVYWTLGHSLREFFLASWFRFGGLLWGFMWFSQFIYQLLNSSCWFLIPLSIWVSLLLLRFLLGVFCFRYYSILLSIVSPRFLNPQNVLDPFLFFHRFLQFLCKRTYILQIAPVFIISWREQRLYYLVRPCLLEQILEFQKVIVLLQILLWG